MADFNIEKAIADKKAEIAKIQRKLSIVKKGKPVMDTDALDEQGYRDAAKAYGERDPATAFNLIAKADALKAKREGKADDTNPDNVRFKVQSALNQLMGELSTYQQGGGRVTDPAYQNRIALINALREEMGSDTPSLQRAYLKASQPTTSINEAPTSGVLTYDALVSSINKLDPKSPNIKGDVAKLRQQIPNANMTDPQRQAVDQAIADKLGAIPKAEGKPTESKQEFDAFKEGSKTTLTTIAGAVALGQTMGPKIRSAIAKGARELDQSDTQQLAAMIYQTYNPGTLVSGEMTSAVGALKGTSAWRQYIDAGMSKIGVSSQNTVPIRQAVEKYNEAIRAGGAAYNEMQSKLKQYKSGNKDYKLTDAYMGGMSNPSSYVISNTSSGTQLKDKAQPTTTRRAATADDLKALGL